MVQATATTKVKAQMDIENFDTHNGDTSVCHGTLEGSDHWRWRCYLPTRPQPGDGVGDGWCDRYGCGWTAGNGRGNGDGWADASNGDGNGYGDSHHTGDGTGDGDMGQQ